MPRRVILVALLIVALVLIAAPAVIAMRAILRGNVDEAWSVFGPVLLVPLGFLLVGVIWSFRRGPDNRE